MLRKYPFRLLSALQLRATPAVLPLNDALDTLREILPCLWTYAAHRCDHIVEYGIARKRHKLLKNK